MKILRTFLLMVILLYACTAKKQTTVKMETHREGNWTVYVAPEWQQQKAPLSISSIAIASDGTIWFGTTGGPVSIGTGVYRFDGNLWTRYTSKNSGLLSDEVSSIATNPNGTIWFTTFCCGVERFDGKTWTTYTTADGLASNDTRSSAVASDGSVWFGTEDKGVSRFDGKTWTTYNMQKELWGDMVDHISVLPDGSLLFSNSNGTGARVTRYDGQHWSTFSIPPSLAEENIYAQGNYVEDIATTPDGSLWLATEKDGVYRLIANTWTHYTMQDGLASNNVYCAVVAYDSSIWVGTLQGFSRFDGKEWRTIPTPNEHIGCPAVKDANGNIWFGGVSAIYRYQPSK